MTADRLGIIHVVARDIFVYLFSNFLSNNWVLLKVAYRHDTQQMHIDVLVWYRCNPVFAEKYVSLSAFFIVVVRVLSK